ncbi:hypothetical protein STEG23_020160, partial [Scotinomys teguina]
MSCPPLNCSPDSLPVHISGQCCKVCRPKCIYGGKVLAEGQRILTKSCRECRHCPGSVYTTVNANPSVVLGYEDMVGSKLCSIFQGLIPLNVIFVLPITLSCLASGMPEILWVQLV